MKLNRRDLRRLIESVINERKITVSDKKVGAPKPIFPDKFIEAFYKKYSKSKIANLMINRMLAYQIDNIDVDAAAKDKYKESIITKQYKGSGGQLDDFAKEVFVEMKNGNFNSMQYQSNAKFNVTGEEEPVVMTYDIGHMFSPNTNKIESTRAINYIFKNVKVTLINDSENGKEVLLNGKPASLRDGYEAFKEAGMNLVAIGEMIRHPYIRNITNDSMQSKEIVEKQLASVGNETNESLSRGSIYRKRYRGRY